MTAAAQSVAPLSPEEIARRSADAMWATDHASQGLGMEIVSVGPGTATLAMTLTERMCNGFGMGHGGFIFALADSAFAFACNSHNFNTVGAGCTIDYLAPGRPGDVLVAEAVEQALQGKTGVYDVAVTDQDGRTIALFRGKSHRVTGTLVPMDA